MDDALLRRIAVGVGLPVASIRRLVVSAPFRYKQYYIPKRSGKGMRRIAQPAKEIKAIQRWIVSVELERLPIHKLATAYVAGSSIKSNAEAHAKNRFLLKADFENFFPSIKEDDLVQHFNKYSTIKYSVEDLQVLCRYLLWQPKSRERLELCIGAPSSPFISNTLMYDFDVALANYADSAGITYTRYADDLSFSTSEAGRLKEVLPYIRTLLTSLPYPSIHLNEDKSVFTSKKYRRVVTGLVLSNEGCISMGRARKRLIHAMVHQFSLGKLDEQQSFKLRGLLAFAADVEPGFLLTLRNKYSVEVIERIRGSKPAETRRQSKG